MKNGASDASWIGTITSILFTNAKTVTNYTYVLLLRVSVSVALLNSFKSMHLRPPFQRVPTNFSTYKTCKDQSFGISGHAEPCKF